MGVNGEKQYLDEGTGLDIYSRPSPACLWGANNFRPDLQALTRKMLRHPEGPSQQQRLHLQAKLLDRAYSLGMKMYVCRQGMPSTCASQFSYLQESGDTTNISIIRQETFGDPSVK